MPRRRRDSGHFGHHNDCFMPCVIVAILVAIAIPAVLGARRRAKQEGCLKNLVARSAGIEAGAACPSCDLPYAAGEPIACPAAESHLPTRPRFEKGEAGGWKFRQDFPEGPSEISVGGWFRFAEVRQTESRVTIIVRGRGWWRWAGGPVLALVTGGVSILGLGALAYGVTVLIRKRGKDGIEGCGALLLVGVIALTAWWTWGIADSAWGTEEINFGPGRTIGVRARIGSWVVTEQRLEDVKALVPPDGGVPTLKAVVIRDGRPEVVRLTALTAESAGAVKRLHEVLFGP